MPPRIVIHNHFAARDARDAFTRYRPVYEFLIWQGRDEDAGLWKVQPGGKIFHSLGEAEQYCRDNHKKATDGDEDPPTIQKEQRERGVKIPMPSDPKERAEYEAAIKRRKAAGGGSFVGDPRDGKQVFLEDKIMKLKKELRELRSKGAKVPMLKDPKREAEIEADLRDLERRR